MLRSLIRTVCAAVSLVLLPAPVAAAPAAAGPVVFGTVALAAGTTPYDQRWGIVQSQALGSGAGIATKARGLEGLERLRFVNRAVNAAISYRGDAGDSWASASESFKRGAGDCEDYAIAKMQVLRSVGVPASDLFLVIGRDLAAGSDHAMLIVRSGGSYWVLDNFINEVHADSDYSEFRPVITLSSQGRWLHGYKQGAALAVQAAASSQNSAQSSSGASLAAILTAQSGG